LRKVSSQGSRVDYFTGLKDTFQRKIATIETPKVLQNGLNTATADSTSINGLAKLRTLTNYQAMMTGFRLAEGLDL
jgi:hypothetical protein